MPALTSPRAAPLGGLARQPRGLGVALPIAAVVPAGLIAYWLLDDLFFGGSHLGADPIKEGEHLLGNWTLRFLVLTLAITPLRRLTGWNWLARHRRTLGLVAFGYACLHLLTWFLLDMQFFISDFVGWKEFREDVLDRPYITIGMLAFVLMIPLALTSTKRMIARLGKRWTALHRLVYASAVLGTIHFWMSVKRDIAEPLVFAALFAALLGWRVLDARRRRAEARAPSASA
jgi:sulfoxide reductase heme-binding subunit YedZ